MEHKTLTFDWNCVIAVENNEPSAKAIRKLIGLHRENAIEVALLATSASENLSKMAGFPATYSKFSARIDEIGWADLPVLLTPGVIGLTFIGRCFIVDSNRYNKLSNDLWETIFQNFPRNPKDYSEDSSERDQRRWRNAWCDVHSLYTHVHFKRDCFVTLNTNDFQNKEGHLKELGSGEILTPIKACEWVLG